MDRVLLEKYSKELESRTLRIDQYVIKKLGIKKQNIFIKIRDHTIYCIPFDISMTSSRVIVALSPKELEFFSQFSGDKHPLHFKLFSYGLDREVSFFVWATISGSKLLNQKNNMCFLNLNFHAPPNEYKEILVSFFLREDNNKRAWEDQEKNGKILERKELRKNGFHDHVTIKNDQGVCLEGCELIQLSLKTVRFLLYSDPDRPELGKENLQMEINKEDYSIFIDLVVTEDKEMEDLPGFYLVDCDIPYSTMLVEELSALL